MLRSILLISTIILLGSCSSARERQIVTANDQSRVLRQEPQAGNVVNNRYAGLSPLEAHKQARKRVRPNDINGSKFYTSKAKDQPSQQETRKATVIPKHKPKIQPAQEQKLAALDKMMPHRSTFLVPEDVLTDIPKPMPKPIPAQKTAAASSAPQSSTQLKPVPKPAARAQQNITTQTINTTTTKIAPTQKYGATIQNIRIGQHTDKTRIVLDTNADTSFSTVMDASKKSIVMHLPDAKWSGKTQHIFTQYKLIEAYLSKPRVGGGTLLALRFKHPIDVILEKKMLPSGASGHRIVIDVRPTN